MFLPGKLGFVMFDSLYKGFSFIGNERKKQATSRCTVDISDIVNRIAPQVIIISSSNT